MNKSDEVLENIFTSINKVYQDKGKCIIGLSGLQGTGKTTLGYKLQTKFEKIGIKFITISIDDFYLSYKERQLLDQQYYPFRGSPGTHDYKLIQQTFLDFTSNKDLTLPKFDKSLHNGKGDRIDSIIVKDVDILLLEGWFIGFQLIKDIDENLLLPNNQLLNKDLAIFMNNALGSIEYLWKYFDHLIHIKTNDLNYNIKWRLEAEQELRLKTGHGQLDGQIIDFISYMWNCLHPSLYNVKSNYQITIDDKRNLVFNQM